MKKIKSFGSLVIVFVVHYPDAFSKWVHQHAEDRGRARQRSRFESRQHQVDLRVD